MLKIVDMQGVRMMSHQEVNQMVIDNQEIINRNLAHMERENIEMQKALALSRIYSILHSEPVQPPATQQELQIATTVHAVVQKYDRDADGELTKQEVTPFIKSFIHYTLGCPIEMSHSQDMINNKFESFSCHEQTIDKIKLFNALKSEFNKGSCHNALMEV